MKEEDDVWFANAPLGKGTLANMTKRISETAGCAKLYTNHSLRATSVTMLDHAGYASRDIMTVSGHRSESSIKNYMYVRTSEDKKKSMSETLSTKINDNVKDGAHPTVSVSTTDSVQADLRFTTSKPHSHTSRASTSIEQPSTSHNNVELVESDTDMFTDSQLEQVLNEIPNSTPLNNITNNSNIPNAIQTI